MPNLTEHQREHIIDLLEQGQEIPLDYKHLLFPPERQEYELVYAGKEREEDILAETMAVPLQAIKTFGSNGNDWHNMLIFGDNLQALKTLLQMKERGKLINKDGSLGVKLIYIDPPFATKKEFQGNQDQRAYLDKIAGAQFIEFLRKRLIFMKKLLSDNGSIFVHLDWRKAHYLKTIMDEIFGEHNFRNEVIWFYKRWSAGSKQYQRQHESLLYYSKYRENITFNNQYELYTEGTLKRWKGIKRKTTLDENGKLVQVQDAQGTRGSNMGDVWPISIINANAKERTEFPTQKPEELLERVIYGSSDPGDIVLDAFAGSGTTMAVAEKLRRHWIGIDCSKLSIYTIQKRMLNLHEKIGEKGKRLKSKSFTVYNAGLYDFSRLKRLHWEGWHFFALHLFQCRDEPHTVGGVKLDGYRGADDVLVFNHLQYGGVVLDYGFIDDLHNQIGGKVGSRFFIIAPAASVTFLEDYIDKNRTRYYVLRIPYSIINELHTRDFEAITQPIDESQVNETVEVVGFDFTRLPEVKCQYLVQPREGQLIDEAVILIKTFKSKAMAKGAIQKGNRETLSMVMVDYDYDGEIFDLDEVFYAAAIEADDWQFRIPLEPMGKQIMIIYIDIYGNEYKEVKAPTDFQPLNDSATKQETTRA